MDIKSKINIGKIKVIIDRQRNYISIIQFVMIGYLFFKEVGWDWYYLAIIPFWLWFTWYDLVYIAPKELDYWHGKSPVLKEILRRSK